MSIESRSRQYGKVFDHWQIREFLGSGSGGKSAVFRLVHSSSSSVKSALKVISLIEKRGKFENLSEVRKDEYIQAKKKCKEDAEREVLLMNGLQGRSNVVDYLDHTFTDWEDDCGFGCDMLIRMELLQDLRSQIEDDHKFSQSEVLKIGQEICSALVLCHSKNILHRDIKPENIFFNSDGNYKLGDFGVSRILSAAPMSKASTGVCTPEYAAPEQMSDKYDTRVDIYSLGLVLYELSNDNLLPFATSSYVTELEVQQRILGTPLPLPRNASKALASVILKACAFNPEERYQTAEDFLSSLNSLAGDDSSPVAWSTSVGRGTQTATPATERNATQYATPDTTRKARANETVYASSGAVDNISCNAVKKEKAKAPKTVIIGIALILVLGIGVAAFWGLGAVSAREEIIGIIDEAEALTESKNYEDAISLVQEGLDEYPDSDELKEKLDEIMELQNNTEITAIIDEADALALDTGYEAAIARLEEGLLAHPESVSLQSKVTHYRKALAAQIKVQTLTDAKALADVGDYEAAMSVIKEAQEAYGTNKEYDEAYSSYDKAFSQQQEESVSTTEPFYGIIDVSAGGWCSFALHSDGTVLATGRNQYGQCDVESWTNIIAISGGDSHTVGLKSNGTVAVTGINNYGQCDITHWENIVGISAGTFHTAGIKKDGTAVASGRNDAGQCNVEGWTDIVQICAGEYHTVGLRADGTVVAVGKNNNGQCNVSEWTDIVAVGAGVEHTVGLKADGTVVTIGSNKYGQCNVGQWKSITSIVAGDYHTVALRADGNVLATGFNDHGQCKVSSWMNIVKIAARYGQTLGLTADGKVLAVGWKDYGICNVSGW